MPHVGKRGRMLLFFGGLDLVIAVSLARPDAETRRGAYFTWLAAIAPTWVWAAVWAVVGVTCLWQAFCHRDSIGYAAAIALKVFWALACIGAWLFGGFDRGYVSAAIWLGLAYMVSVISGWAEPGDLRGPTWTRPSPPR
jgi:hypothetical protein